MIRNVPVFPLSTVLFPGLILPLHVFEPRYRALTQDLLAMPEDERVFAVVAIRAGHDIGPKRPSRALYGTGCLARVQKIDELPDGRYDLNTVGTTRVKLRDFDPHSGRIAGKHSSNRTSEHQSWPYLRAEVEDLEEDDGDAPEVVARAVRKEFSRYREALGVSMLDTDLDARLLSYVVASAMLLDLEERQSLLEAPDTTTRLRLGLRLLRRESVLLRTLRAVPGTDAARMPPADN